MAETKTSVALARVFAELVHGASVPGGSLVLNSGDPFSDARWDVAWTTVGVDASQWDELRAGRKSESLPKRRSRPNPSASGTGQGPTQ